jgi:hypothetical protein
MDQLEWLKDVGPKLSLISAEWDKAEADIKLAEQVCDVIVLPSINELRYAGRRLIDALTAIKADDEPSRAHSLIDDAKFNCHRARHDALDAATAKIAADVEGMIKHLGFDVVSQCFPELPELRLSLRQARDRIVESRANREARDLIYRTLLETNLPALVRLHALLMEGEAPMKELVQAARRRELRNNIFGWGGLIFGLVGIAIGGTAWVFPHLFGG